MSSHRPTAAGQPSSRRHALKLGGGIALAAPAIAAAQTATTLRFQSAWPAKAIFHEFAVDVCRNIEQATGGKLKIQMLPSGAVVPPLQLIDAVSKGTVDGGHAVPGFWFGRNTAFGLYGAGPHFGLDANQTLGWMEFGGGKQLYAEALAAAKLDVHSLLYGPVPTEPFGWFRKEVKTPADLKGLKYRTAGLAVDMMAELGAAPVQLAPADIVPSLERGVIDAAEFANITDDRTLGFPDVAKNYYLQSYHMCNNVFELSFNKPKYDALPAEVKAAIDMAVRAANSDMLWKSMDRMSDDLIALQTKDKVKVMKTPAPILAAQLEAWKKVLAARSAENALFAKTAASQKAWAKKVVYWSELTTVEQLPAYRSFFG
ncbi:TRAP transporter substrate-binding protein [Piscinibacter sakaiensis]|uniref:TRAP-type C4-dicarboxylate transport system, periplasmic component n=1 Tax=Piscinibacter sakaiensis TaxID=1547922 RepID=A0A0K8P245_PISS1|nr:TRAP transporter substrate-binding protein [Piscinibacter sakaiensis]GAP36742.1 TRAP-type C4-dicarboxylate transport system, periplasmic component [Piscinibacter sakaiensis]